MIQFIKVITFALRNLYAKHRELYEESIYERASMQDVFKDITDPILGTHMHVVSFERGERKSERETLDIKRESFEKAIEAYKKETVKLPSRRKKSMGGVRKGTKTGTS